MFFGNAQSKHRTFSELRDLFRNRPEDQMFQSGRAAGRDDATQGARLCGWRHPYEQRGIRMRGIIGTWHRLSAKHLPAYLDEMTWRFNNRQNPFLFRDTMLKLIASSNLEYKQLTQAA